MQTEIERPRRLTREEARLQTRERLLDAAAAVFNEHGYAGASLDAVAEAAGYTKGAVYSNFATKADLFLALLERWIAREQEVQSGMLESMSLGEFLDSLGGIFQRQTQADPGWVPLQIEFWLAAVRDPAMRPRYLEGTEETCDVAGTNIDAKLAEAGARTPFTGRELTILLNALGTGLAIEYHLKPEALDPMLMTRAARVLGGLPPTEAGPSAE